MSDPTKGLASKSFLLPVIIGCHQVSLVVSALLDSGTEGNFIHTHLVEPLQIPVETLKTPLKIAALDGGPVGAGSITTRTEPVLLETSSLHSELISFLVLDHPEFEIILGLPWLERHDPTISWPEHEFKMV